MLSSHYAVCGGGGERKEATSINTSSRGLY